MPEAFEILSIEGMRFLLLRLYWVEDYDVPLDTNTSYLYDRWLLIEVQLPLEELVDIPRDRFLGAYIFVRANNSILASSLNINLTIIFKIQLPSILKQNNRNSQKYSTPQELDETTGEGCAITLIMPRNSKYMLCRLSTSEFNTGSVEHQLLFKFDLQRL